MGLIILSIGEGEKMFKRLKKSINKFLDDIAKENEKQFGTKGQLDCCKLNNTKKDNPCLNK